MRLKLTRTPQILQVLDGAQSQKAPAQCQPCAHCRTAQRHVGRKLAASHPPPGPIMRCQPQIHPVGCLFGGVPVQRPITSNYHCLEEPPQLINQGLLIRGWHYQRLCKFLEFHICMPWWPCWVPGAAFHPPNAGKVWQSSRSLQTGSAASCKLVRWSNSGCSVPWFQPGKYQLGEHPGIFWVQRVQQT